MITSNAEVRPPTKLRDSDRTHTVRILRPGRIAHPRLVQEPQIEAKEGMELHIDEEWARTLCEVAKPPRAEYVDQAPKKVGAR